jgi:hypothetical protein
MVVFAAYPSVPEGARTSTLYTTKAFTGASFGDKLLEDDKIWSLKEPRRWELS